MEVKPLQVCHLPDLLSVTPVVPTQFREYEQIGFMLWIFTNCAHQCYKKTTPVLQSGFTRSTSTGLRLYLYKCKMQNITRQFLWIHLPKDCLLIINEKERQWRNQSPANTFISKSGDSRSLKDVAYFFVWLTGARTGTQVAWLANQMPCNHLQFIYFPIKTNVPAKISKLWAPVAIHNGLVSTVFQLHHCVTDWSWNKARSNITYMYHFDESQVHGTGAWKYSGTTMYMLKQFVSAVILLSNLWQVLRKLT